MKFSKVFIFLLVLLGACPARAGITFNTSTVGSADQASPATVTITAAVGDLLVACFTTELANLTGVAASDAQGSYTLAASSTEGSNTRATRQFYLPNANAGSHTLSVSWTGSPAHTNLNIMAFTGVVSASPSDVTGSLNSGTIASGDNPIGTLATQSQTGEVFVGCGRTSVAGTFTVGSNMTALISGTGDGMEYRIVGSDLHPFTGQMACAGCAAYGYSGTIASYKATPSGSRFVRLDSPAWELDGGRWAITDRERKRV